VENFKKAWFLPNRHKDIKLHQFAAKYGLSIPKISFCPAQIFRAEPAVKVYLGKLGNTLYVVIAKRIDC